jgi:hypothetical protein
MICDLTGGLTFYSEGRAKLYTSVSLNVTFDIIRDSSIICWKENADNFKIVLKVFNEQTAGR